MNPFLPTSIIKASRHETPEPVTLQVDCPGQPQPSLPAGLHGHIFIVAPLPPRAEAPQIGERSVVNGDGMIYRLSFQAGQATLKTAIAKTPCYYADLATQVLPEYKDLRFRDGGVPRLQLSLGNLNQISLGNRNQLNTAFLKTNRRLFVTYDAGRPYSIDPETLEIVEPLGNAAEWRPLLPLPIQQIFEVYSSSAHPVCEPQLSASKHLDATDEGFIVNYSPGYNGRFRAPVNRLLNWLFRQLNRGSKQFNSLFKGQLAVENAESWGAFTDLIRYRSQPAEPSCPEYELERWHLQLADGSPVIIKQSVHQMAITEEYVILGDLAFGLEYTQIFSPYLLGFLWNPNFRKVWFFTPLGAWLYMVFLQLTETPPFTDFYVIRRADCDQDNNPIELAPPNQRVKTLTAIKLSIPRTVSHFAVDYQNPNDQLTFHVGHHNGLDPTEWINEYDQPVNNPKSKGYLRTDLRGVLAGTTDLGTFGRYVFDAKTGTLLKSNTIGLVGDDPNLPPKSNSWLPSVYSHCDLTPANGQVQQIYWTSWGFSWEVIPQRVYDAYKDREYREVPLASLPSEDMPPTLLCLDTTQMKVVDAFAFPPSHALFSPQYLPHQDAEQPGFVICVVLTDDEIETPNQPKDEFWIFQADNLKQGPICKLSHPDLNLGLTLHSTWMSDQEFVQCRYSCEAERQERRRNSFEADYAAKIEQASQTDNEANQRIKMLFNMHIIESFANQKLEKEIVDSVQSQSA